MSKPNLPARTRCAARWSTTCRGAELARPPAAGLDRLGHTALPAGCVQPAWRIARRADRSKPGRTRGAEPARSVSCGAAIPRRVEPRDPRAADRARGPQGEPLGRAGASLARWRRRRNAIVHRDPTAGLRGYLRRVQVGIASAGASASSTPACSVHCCRTRRGNGSHPTVAGRWSPRRPRSHRDGSSGGSKVTHLDPDSCHLAADRRPWSSIPG
jgi:hypothetical protein